ncbi:MAG: hypothetical protein NTZ46_00220 [Verrucomicrobia bacterium]|nr:hypothetical protein [Verrucomicrobiota bacterium]
MKNTASGFTLIEILFASMAAALILVAVYGIFQRAIKTRDHATARIRQALQRERAVTILRNDLRCAYISGGVLASSLEGGAQTQKSRFPGYLRFTTTTGKNRPDEAYGDVQQVEYYITEPDSLTSGSTASPSENNSDTSGDSKNTGTLVRALSRDLLSPVEEAGEEQPILTRVQSFEVTFFDGMDWQGSWQVTDTEPTLPQAVRIRIQQTAASEQLPTPVPLEITVPLTTEPLNSSTPSVTTSSTAATTGTTP